MEQTHAQKGFASKISVESSRRSNRSGMQSLQRSSWNGRVPSLQNRISLIDAMDIEVNHQRHSDVFERLLDSQKNRKFGSRNSANPLGNHNNQFSNIQYGSGIQQGTNNYFENAMKQQQMQANIRINHTCQCYGDDCDRQSCPCYQYQTQLCIKGMCCVQCITIKNFLFQKETNSLYDHSHNNINGDSSRQNTHPNIQNVCTCKNTKCLKSYCSCFQNGGYCSPSCKCEDCSNRTDSLQRETALQAMKNVSKNQDQMACTCKKTKCNKKYCRCYASGIKCGKMCSCEGCLNCDKFQDDMEMDIENGYYYQQNNDVEMPAQIQFDPPQLPHY